MSIPGGASEVQINILINAINGLNKGRLKGIIDNLK